MDLLGLRIVPHIFAREVRTEYRVMTWAARDKKRKNWRVERVDINRPSCFIAGNTAYMHPEVIAKLFPATRDSDVSGSEKIRPTTLIDGHM
jgi:hypothetical protein